MDGTKEIRRAMVQEINLVPGSREALEADYGKVWDTNQLQEDFNVLGFMAPFVIVERKSEKLKGTLLFQHSPRFYFTFRAD
jgi:hypothetical protein